jgi:hypothetical protein
MCTQAGLGICLVCSTYRLEVEHICSGLADFSASWKYLEVLEIVKGQTQL